MTTKTIIPNHNKNLLVITIGRDAEEIDRDGSLLEYLRDSSSPVIAFQIETTETKLTNGYEKDVCDVLAISLTGLMDGHLFDNNTVTIIYDEKTTRWESGTLNGIGMDSLIAQIKSDCIKK